MRYWCVLKVQGRRLFILEVELLLVRRRRNLCFAEYLPGFKIGLSPSLYGADCIPGYKLGTSVFLLKTRPTSRAYLHPTSPPKPSPLLFNMPKAGC